MAIRKNTEKSAALNHEKTARRQTDQSENGRLPGIRAGQISGHGGDEVNKAKILIVDDKPENLLALERLLETQDAETIRAASGEEALAHILDHDFALILLDVNMPGMDGYELASLLRGNSRSKHIPIIFITAANQNWEQLYKGFDYGAVDYFFKPLDSIVLTGKVKVFLNLYHQQQLLREKAEQLDRQLIELESLRRKLEKANEKLQHLSTTDALTGLMNRRRFDEIFKDEWQRAVRDKHPLTLLMIDIDHFKMYNDTYGHLQGDRALIRVAQSLLATVRRPTDRVIRYGGEEFLVILPDTDALGGYQVAEKLRLAAQAMNLEHKSSPVAAMLTISVGVATAVPQARQSMVRLLAAADDALYEAKEQGRNRSVGVEIGAAKLIDNQDES
ncbi:MAG: diguanylate cyclase [Desulfobulbaceae bacterium]|nr:diguanylate cyclase [Desulfobulbaceae bacterium]